MDLYLRLWKCEARTYPFLHELLSVPYAKEKDAWELNVTKAQTIREICLLKYVTSTQKHIQLYWLILLFI